MTTADLAVQDGLMTRGDRPKRRRFSAEFKASLLAEYDAADKDERGLILRREGIYSSHIAEWRKAAAQGARAGLEPRVGETNAERRRDREMEQLRVRAERAEAELARTRAALDIMGKAHALLETLSESADMPPRSPR